MDFCAMDLKTLRGAATICFATLVLNGCAPDLTVRRVRPAPVASTASPGDHHAPVDKNPAPLLAALEVLRRTDPGFSDATVRAARRNATAQIIDLYAPALLTTPYYTVQVLTGNGTSLQLRLQAGPGAAGVEPSRFERLEPTDHWLVKGVSQLAVTPGEGVPLVGTLRPVPPVSADVSGPVHAVGNLVWAATAVPALSPSGHARDTTLTLTLYNPYVARRVTAPNGKSSPLAADFTTPPAVAFAYFGPKRLGISRFLGMRKDFASTGLFATQPPDAVQTPLVLVHGLISDPSDFHALQIALANDLEVRRRYQVWFFYYPSSLPVPYSATLLREDLVKFIHGLDPAGTHPALHRAVLVGHSMGGLLCRLAITDGGDRYYHHFFRQPLDHLRLTLAQRDLLRRTFYSRAAPDVAQVVFIATPHRGSKLAGGLLGTFGRLLVRVPLAVRTRISHILTNNRAALANDAPLKPASSITSLSPHDPVIVAMDDLPMRSGVRLHSILGDRGRPGPREQSSDGVVPYASSHLPQAESEVRVPAGHTGTLGRSETAAELLRILHGADREEVRVPEEAVPARNRENH